MIKEFVGIEEALEVLNRLVEKDKVAATCLVDIRIPCSIDVAFDDTIQTGFHVDYEATLGLLGVVNGIFGVDSKGQSAIVAEYGYVCTCDVAHDVEGSKDLEACPMCGSEVEPLFIKRFVRNPNLTQED